MPRWLAQSAPPRAFSCAAATARSCGPSTSAPRSGRPASSRLSPPDQTGSFDKKGLCNALQTPHASGQSPPDLPLRQSHKTILIWAILILMFVSIYSMFTDSSTKERELDVTAFQALLTNKDEANRIERIAIEPRGHDDARYVLTMKNSSPAAKQVVYAEFPG